MFNPQNESTRAYTYRIKKKSNLDDDLDTAMKPNTLDNIRRHILKTKQKHIRNRNRTYTRKIHQEKINSNHPAKPNNFMSTETVKYESRRNMSNKTK